MKKNFTDNIADVMANIPFGASGKDLAEAVTKIGDILEREARTRKEPFDKARFIERGCSLA